MSKPSDKTGTEPSTADATEVDSSPSFATDARVNEPALGDDTAVDAPAIPPRAIPDRSQFLLVSEESTPGDSGGTTASGRNSLRKLLDGLKWRRADPVVVRSSSEGAEAARYHAFHELREPGVTPPPLDAVLLHTTVERDSLRISPRRGHEAPSSPPRTDDTVDIPGRWVARPSRNVAWLGAIGGAFLLVVATILLLSGRSAPSAADSARSGTRESPAATAPPPIRPTTQPAVVVPVVPPIAPSGSETHVREKPSGRPAPLIPPPARPEASKPPKAEYPEL